MHDQHPGEQWDAKRSGRAARAPDNKRAQELLGRLTIARRGYLDLLPEADEAIINLARQLVAEPDEFAKGGKIEIRSATWNRQAHDLPSLWNWQPAFLPSRWSLGAQKFRRPTHEYR